MYGPSIICRTLSQPSIADRHGNRWQYYSHSDRHTKVACWAIVFDLLLQCPILRRHAARGEVTFALNREMQDFWTGDRKTVDLVIGQPAGASGTSQKCASFGELRDKCHIELSDQEADLLEFLPVLVGEPVRNIYVAVDARACMTGHVAAIPRLDRDLSAGHRTIHGAADAAIAAGCVLLNTSEEFVSPDRNRFSLATRPAVVSRHSQPGDASRVSTKVHELMCRDDPQGEGYDALSLIAVAARNDGQPVELVTRSPAPNAADVFHYDQMLGRMARAYETRFASV